MTLKRKRSDSEISTSSSSILSSPPKNYLEPAYASPSPSQSLREVLPPHLSGRTRKRFRDNRPSETVIHQNTLSMLFSAQRNLQPSQTQRAPVLTPTSNDHTQQVSLHSFWSLPSRPSSCGSNDESNCSPPTASYQATNCEDCDAALVSADGDAMDVDMDAEFFAGSMDYACSRCCKQICHHCAVSNLGVERQCLICAGKRAWVGGIGWMDQD